MSISLWFHTLVMIMILNDFTICFLPRDFGGIWSNLAAPKARGNGGVRRHFDMESDMLSLGTNRFCQIYIFFALKISSTVVSITC